MILVDLVEFVNSWRQRNPRGSKADLAAATLVRFRLAKDGALLIGERFAVRFCQSKFERNFPNGVVAIAKIVQHDHLPVVVCVLTPVGCRLMLANTTFLSKVSHSSHAIARDNLRGTILGTDILTEIAGFANEPRHFRDLWQVHERADRMEHLARIVDATQAVEPTRARWTADATAVAHVLAAPSLAIRLSAHADYDAVRDELDGMVHDRRALILEAARDPNNKTRGEAIEQVLTRRTGQHDLGDIQFRLEIAVLRVDVKSKLSGRGSAPKAWNIDRTLSDLAKGDHLLSMYFVRVDLPRAVIDTRLASIFDRILLGASVRQSHWSGRGTRGTIQFSGSLDAIWSPGFRESIDVGTARRFLQELIDVRPNG